MGEAGRGQESCGDSVNRASSKAEGDSGLAEPLCFDGWRRRVSLTEMGYSRGGSQGQDGQRRLGGAAEADGRAAHEPFVAVGCQFLRIVHRLKYLHSYVAVWTVSARSRAGISLLGRLLGGLRPG